MKSIDELRKDWYENKEHRQLRKKLSDERFNFW